MNVGQLLFALRDAVNYLEAKGMLKVDGTVLLNDINNDVALASVIEGSLKAHGIDTPEVVDKVIQALPLFVSIFVR